MAKYQQHIKPPENVQYHDTLKQQLAAAQAEIERLRGEIEDAFREGYRDGRENGIAHLDLIDVAWAGSFARSRAALSASPPAPTEQAGAPKSELDIIKDFYQKVNERAAQNMTKTGVVSGAHWNAMKSIISEMEGKQGDDAPEAGAPAAERDRDFEGEARAWIARQSARGHKILWVYPDGHCFQYHRECCDSTVKNYDADSVEALNAVAASLRRGHTYDDD